MGDRKVLWPYLLLSTALLGALAFGWNQNRQRRQLALETENMYMSAFHKLKWTSENVEESLARLLVTHDRQLQEGMLADLRVFSAQAVEHLAALPLATVDTRRIQHFLNTLRDSADAVHEKINQGSSLKEQEWAHLAELHRQAVIFEEELARLAGLVGNGLIRWRETVHLTSLGPEEQERPRSTPILRAVQQLNQELPSPPKEAQVLLGKRLAPRTVPGPLVDEAAALAAIKRFVDLPLKGEPKLTAVSDPPEEIHGGSLYFFEAQKINGTPVALGVLVHGGHVMFLLDGRPVEAKRLSHQKLVDQAERLLRRWGYPPVVLVSAVENDRTYVMDFAPVEEGVALHVDRIKLMLAMDNGELVGFDASSYWLNRRLRQLSAPELTPEAITTQLSPRVRTQGEPQLALVLDRGGRERLAWEVQAAAVGNQFRIYVDALTGQEFEVVRLSGAPAPSLVGQTGDQP